eukprot:gb/GFBE01050624.1/.p1 GENE.gb/GFBE01050624.1/~~gb/GFBE01050624.1/.p1  ORF type:complete len:309 (+),score=79.55 gb/GFBE01050624.1/:1-927(+)
MALKLFYRSTFIDVEEEMSCSAGLRVRARSLPAITRTPATEVHQEESQLSNYVTTLAQRAEQLCVLLRREGSLAQLKEEPTPEPKTKMQMELETSSTATPHDSSESMEKLSSKASVVHHELSPCFEAVCAKSISDSLTAEVMPCPGSVGHPEVCRRPCLYYAAGCCSNGDACGYCHLAHTQRPSHLDKQQREALKKLSDADLLKMLAKQMRARAADKGFLAEASEVLRLMEGWGRTATKAPSCAAAAPATRHLAKLEYHLSKMTFASLLGLAVRGQKTSAAASHQGQVADALTSMRARLLAAGRFELQ